MTSKETHELRARDDDHLRQDLESAHQALFNLRFQSATRQLADVAQVAKARKRIARTKTLLRERAILAEADAMSRGSGRLEAEGAASGAPAEGEE